MKTPLHALAVKAASRRHGFHCNSSSLCCARLGIATEEGRECSVHVWVCGLVCKCTLVKQHCCLSILPSLHAISFQCRLKAGVLFTLQ